MDDLKDTPTNLPAKPFVQLKKDDLTPNSQKQSIFQFVPRSGKGWDWLVECSKSGSSRV